MAYASWVSPNKTQAAGDAYLTIEPTTINLTAAGTAVNVTVESNTSWTIS